MDEGKQERASPKETLEVAPADEGWCRAGRSDSEVMPGRKVPVAVAQGTSCLSVCPAASHPCQHVAQSQERPKLPNTHALWPCKAKSHGLVFTSTAVQLDLMSKHCASPGITAAVPSKCPLTSSICSNCEYPSTMCIYVSTCTRAHTHLQEPTPHKSGEENEMGCKVGEGN